MLTSDERDSRERTTSNSPRTNARDVTVATFGIAISAIRACPNRILEAGHYVDFPETGLCPCNEQLAIQKARRQPSRARACIDAVMAFYDLDEEDLTVRRRTFARWARYVLAYLLRQHTDRPLLLIGPVIGMTDHSSVLYAIDQVRLKMETDEAFAREVSYVAELAFQMEIAPEDTHAGSTSGGHSRPALVALVTQRELDPRVPAIRRADSR